MMWQSDQSYRSKLLAHVNRKRDRARGENFERIYPQYKNLFTEDDVAWQAGDQS
jgi:hypothetical protein